MTAKPRQDFWQIWNMCFGFVGIQFGFALQNSNVSRIFQTLGASADDIPALWIAAPLTGVLVQPIIGYFSDRTWGRFGRRRPYFLVGATLASLALLAMPNSPTLWVAAGLLWVLDASINVALGPFRSFVGDQLPPSQRAAGYAMQTLFIAVGSVIASLLPWLLAHFGVSNIAVAGSIPETVKWSFYAGAIAMIAAMGWTVMSTREYPPVVSFEATQVETPGTDPRLFAQIREMGKLWLVAGLVALLAAWWLKFDALLFLPGVGMIAYGLVQIAAGAGRRRNVFVEIIDDLLSMPATMRKLAIVQYFSWFAMFAMWIYTTAAVTQVHFGTRDTASAAYNDGANWVGVLFASYNAFAIIAAILIPWMTRWWGLRLTHMFNLTLGALGLVSFLLIHDPRWLLLSMAGVGFAWASILSLPYALLSDSVPEAKMGVYMGIFNLFIVIPQLLAASTLGFLLKTFFANQPINALMLGGISLFLGGLFTLRVAEKPNDSTA
ncbi:MAG: MFS transporter [Dokdonella sp.]|uniref:MFS transporter n=1 Tax=Dokdonella sp. TaxID=2291710 RepID=UPI0032656110